MNPVLIPVIFMYYHGPWCTLPIMLCCVMVSDGEGYIILLKHLNVMLQIVMPCRHRFENVFVQLIVVVACD